MAAPRTAALLLLAALAPGCTAHRPMRGSDGEVEVGAATLSNRVGRAQVSRHDIERHPGYDLVFVEFDDQGQLWNRSRLPAIEEELLYGNVPAGAEGLAVVVYVHGWQRNAGVCGSNVTCFRALLEQIRDDQKAGVAASGNRIKARRIVGVYVGWRGRSVTVPLADDLTFWARRNVAQRIGQGDFVELLTRLDIAVKAMSARYENRSRLVVLGHSLGGAIVFSSLANVFKARLVEASIRQEDPDPADRVIRGFGDLVVLVNPAVEASQFRGMRQLLASFDSFSPVQTPVLVVVGSQTDRTTGFGFRLGRELDTLFQRTSGSEQRRETTTAIGHYAADFNYRLESVQPVPFQGPESSNCSCRLTHRPPNAETMKAFMAAMLERTVAPFPGDRCRPETIYGTARLTCLDAHRARDPFWVVSATDDVIHGHGGFYSDPFVDFLRGVLLESDAIRSSAAAQKR